MYENIEYKRYRRNRRIDDALKIAALIAILGTLCFIVLPAYVAGCKSNSPSELVGAPRP